MLRFFRTLRHRLLTENRVSKYLLYAVGEIVLVVIGILIALQINNWNEARKRRVIEIEVYKEIFHELSETLLSIKDDLEDHLRNQKSNEIVNQVLLQKMEYRDSLEYHLALVADEEMLTLTASGYESLKSMGFDLLTNDSIRHSIIYLYQVALPFLAGRNVEINESVLPLLQRHYKVAEVISDPFNPKRGDLYSIKSYDAFLADDLLAVNLRRTQMRRRRIINEYKRTIGAIEGIMNAIQNELYSLEKI